MRSAIKNKIITINKLLTSQQVIFYYVLLIDGIDIRQPIKRVTFLPLGVSQCTKKSSVRDKKLFTSVILQDEWHNWTNPP